jgi:hypothetical protein
MDSHRVRVEIVAKQKGCMLCDLAVAIWEEIAPEFEPGVLEWNVVDVGSREGLMRYAELKTICSRTPAIPSIVINERIAFDNIPDMEALSAAVRKVIHIRQFNPREFPPDGARVNNRPHSGRLGVSAKGRKDKSTLVLQR